MLSTSHEEDTVTVMQNKIKRWERKNERSKAHPFMSVMSSSSSHIHQQRKKFPWNLHFLILLLPPPASPDEAQTTSYVWEIKFYFLQKFVVFVGRSTVCHSFTKIYCVAACVSRTDQNIPDHSAACLFNISGSPIVTTLRELSGTKKKKKNAKSNHRHQMIILVNSTWKLWFFVSF